MVKNSQLMILLPILLLLYVAYTQNHKYGSSHFHLPTLSELRQKTAALVVLPENEVKNDAYSDRWYSVDMGLQNVAGSPGVKARYYAIHDVVDYRGQSLPRLQFWKGTSAGWEPFQTYLDMDRDGFYDKLLDDPGEKFPDDCYGPYGYDKNYCNRDWV